MTHLLIYLFFNLKRNSWNLPDQWNSYIQVRPQARISKSFFRREKRKLQNDKELVRICQLAQR